jgi:hypothetical protein
LHGVQVGVFIQRKSAEIHGSDVEPVIVEVGLVCADSSPGPFDAVQSDPISTDIAERAEAGYVSRKMFVYNRSSRVKYPFVIHFVSTTS